VLKSNQGVTDTFAVTLQTLVFAFNGIIKAVSSGDFLSIPKVLSEAREQAIELVELQKIAMIADAKRNKLQLESQILAERQRQLRDDERLSIADRIAANQELNRILGEQLIKEEEAAYQKLKVAKLEYDRNPNNENYLQLLEAQTEQIDIQERIEGQMSEYQMNKNSLIREEADLKRLIHEQGQEQYRIEREGDISLMGNRMKALQEQFKLETGLGNARLYVLDEELSKLKEGTLEYQEAYGERMALEAELNAFIKQNAADQAQLRRDNIQKNFDLASQGLGALQALNDAFAKDDEASAKKSFKINKALGISQAVVSTAMAVTAALTAGGNPLKLATGQQFVEAGIAAAAGAAQIATISKQQFGGGAGGTSSVPQPSASTAPSFNLVGSTGDNAILESLRNNPVKAYVVGSDVTSQQQLDRNRINQVSFP
jgi:hypothetical protein